MSNIGFGLFNMFRKYTTNHPDREKNGPNGLTRGPEDLPFFEPRNMSKTFQEAASPKRTVAKNPFL
ncbi:MAG: hypothetical protein C6W57_03915 [Caldibacillus debilis]|nr:hypothetical protein [Bacillaceae bacterium]REJ18292.1 MAG: hypothetical protein C6W57_03915 [Caldibacillus debilis]